MQKKLTPEQKQWANETREWLKTQDVNIESCYLAIKQAKEIIALQKKRILVELAEVKEKKKTKQLIVANLNKFLKHSPKKS